MTAGSGEWPVSFSVFGAPSHSATGMRSQVRALGGAAGIGRQLGCGEPETPSGRSQPFLIALVILWFRAQQSKLLAQIRKPSSARLDTKTHPVTASGDIAAQGAPLSMPNQNSSTSAPKLPFCPSCAQTMRLARITSRFDDLPDLYTFECRTCGVAHIEAAHIDTSQGPLPRWA
jgi:hypothetical protein